MQRMQRLKSLKSLKWLNARQWEENSDKCMPLVESSYVDSSKLSSLL